MKNITIIQRTLDGGGAEKVLVNLLNNIDYKKYNVKLLLIYKQGIYLDSINENVSVRSIYNPKRFKLRIIQSIYCRFMMFLYRYFPKLLYIFFVGKDSDTEIAFLEGEATRFLNFSINKRSTKIAWVHCNINMYREDKLKEFDNYYKYVDKIVCVSNDSKYNFDSAYPHYKDKSTVIYNLIDKNDIIKKSNQAIPYKFNHETTIAIGRLVEEKRFDLLIESHKLLIDEGIYHKLIILGTGPKEEELKKLIKKLNVENTVELLGFIKNPYPYIKNADILVLSSDFEGYPLVIAEALILGKPIVSTRCTGPTEMLDDGKYGILADCGDIFKLKEAIKCLLVDDELRNYYEQKSIERSRILNKENIMKDIYNIL